MLTHSAEFCIWMRLLQMLDVLYFLVNISQLIFTAVIEHDFFCERNRYNDWCGNRLADARKIVVEMMILSLLLTNEIKCQKINVIVLQKG